ncbi:MAG: M3 family oligoendopeptidase [Thaumarchaeota archaeon]|nr:M3 family oligoendopeptidase [Nitrososphaerota archaeon]
MSQTVQSEPMGNDASSHVRWNLSDVLPARSGKIFQAAITDRLEGLLVEFENSRSQLNDSISHDRFTEFLGQFEKICRIRSKLTSYAYMYFSEDTKSQDARTFKARAEEIDADAANRMLFFELWWKSLDSKVSDRLLSDAGSFEYYLRRLIQTRPYTLEEKVEQAINLKDTTGRSALVQIYHQVRDAFAYEVPLGGVTKKLSEEQVRDLFYSSEKEERSAAYHSMLKQFESNRDVLGEIYKTLVRDWYNEGIKLRKYSTPISIRNIANDVPDLAVEALLQSCRENVSLFQRYFKFKAKVLDLPEMSRTDVYSPLPVEGDKVYPWKEGVELVVKSFMQFDESFAAMANNVFFESHVDAEPRDGKLGGAYCMSVTPDITPYILASYTGKPRSVSTLAHELGHAIHSQLSAKRNQNQLTYEPPLPLAETASVFGELILIDAMLAEADEKTRNSILVDQMNDSYATILRQAFFAIFEVEAHEKISAGVNIDDLCDVYQTNLKSQFGNSLHVPEEFRYEWLSIPHIYQSPFYCYSYAWGNLLVMSLYSEYKKLGAEAFAPGYIKMLSYGGAEAPTKILAEAGFDINCRTFWQGGFDQLSGIISELERDV